MYSLEQFQNATLEQVKNDPVLLKALTKMYFGAGARTSDEERLLKLWTSKERNFESDKSYAVNQFTSSSDGSELARNVDRYINWNNSAKPEDQAAAFKEREAALKALDEKSQQLAGMGIDIKSIPQYAQFYTQLGETAGAGQTSAQTAKELGQTTVNLPNEPVRTMSELQGGEASVGTYKPTQSSVGTYQPSQSSVGTYKPGGSTASPSYVYDTGHLSSKANDAAVNQLYNSYFGRNATAAELANWGNKGNSTVKQLEDFLQGEREKYNYNAPVVGIGETSSASKPLTPSGKKATLYGPNGSKEVVDVGSNRASELQSQGWGLTAGSYNDTSGGKKATLYGPNGEKEVVDVGSARASELQSKGWTLTAGGQSSPKKATLYGPNGEKEVVDVGSPRASELQSKGWTLTEGGAKTDTQGGPKKATLYGPNGQKEVVDVGSDRASELQSQGWGLTEGSYKAPGTGQQTGVGVYQQNQANAANNGTNGNTGNTGGTGTTGTTGDGYNSIFDSLLKNNPLIVDYLKDPNNKANFDKLDDTLKMAWITSMNSAQEKIEAGKVINSQLNLSDPLVMKRFLDDATTQLDPYYQEQFKNYEKDLSTSLARLRQDYTDSIAQSEGLFKFKLQTQAEEEAQGGTAFSSGRTDRVNKSIDAQQYNLNNANTALARSLEDLGVSAERKLGSDEFSRYNPSTMAQQYAVSPNGFTPTYSRSLFTPQGNLLGEIPGARTVAVNSEANRLGAVENAQLALNARKLNA